MFGYFPIDVVFGGDLNLIQYFWIEKNSFPGLWEGLNTLRRPFPSSSSSRRFSSSAEEAVLWWRYGLARLGGVSVDILSWAECLFSLLSPSVVMSVSQSFFQSVVRERSCRWDRPYRAHDRPSLVARPRGHVVTAADLPRRKLKPRYYSLAPRTQGCGPEEAFSVQRIILQRGGSRKGWYASKTAAKCEADSFAFYEQRVTLGKKFFVSAPLGNFSRPRNSEELLHHHG